MEILKNGDNEHPALELSVSVGGEQDWDSKTLEIDASSGSVNLTFNSYRPGVYTALDHFTWTPDGE